ncbi:hypothetical protein ACJZ2D_000424 [Fusarium nematophilum]
MASLSNLYVTSDHVRRGGWKNWDDGAASGGQITMLKEDAELLGIFIGIFLVFVAAGLWTLIAYLFFQLNRRSRRKRRMRHQDLPQQPPDNFDGMYHQQQTILRNGGSDIAIGLAFLKLWLAWGRHPGALKRTLPVVVLALGSFGFFLVALPFITAQELFDKQGNEVLVQSPNCGFWSPDLQHHPLDASMVWTNKSFEAISYVDSCYESSVESALCDQFLPMRRLPIVKDRIKLRRTTTCSPLNLDKFSKVMDGPLPGEKVTAVYLGPTAGTNFTYTYGVSNYQIVADASYSLQAFYRRIANDATYSSTFAPVPELHRSDADISIAFFKNNMIPVAGIDGPCKDPIFSATRKELAKMRGYWWPDNRLTAIGCVDQYEFGDPVSGGWTKPASYSDATTNTTFIKQLSKRQLAGFTKFIWSLGLAGGIDFVVDILGTEALRAKKYPGLRDKVQNPLPNDQWKREVEYWFMIGLAKVQLDVVNIAMGPADPTFPGIKDETSKVMADRDDILKIICSSQKVHNLEFKNLHRVGFIVLAVAGGLSVVVPSLVLRAIMWRRKRQEDVLMWTSYGQLQLQRMAAEGAGVSGWRKGNEDVPLLEPHGLLSGDVDVGNLDVDGLPHPIWVGSGSRIVVNLTSHPEDVQGQPKRSSTDVQLQEVPRPDTANSWTESDHARINLGDVNHYYGGLAAPAHTIQFSEEADPLPNGLVLSELPSKAECFFGRGAELGRIKEYLQTTGPNQKGVALCGISGSGKTQVALEYVEREKTGFSAILWIDASSEMCVEDSLASCAAHICKHFPTSNKQIPSRWIVLEWLRSTRYRNWLLVVDSVDDLVPNKSIIEQLGRISHGSLCFTSTHSGIARAARVQPISIEQLDLSASQSLILWRVFDGSKESDLETCEWARQVARRLDRFPLALELAGILAQEGIISIQSSPDVFERQYQQLTKFRVEPGAWPWSRNDSLFGIFEALYKSVAAGNPLEIPVAFLRNIQLDAYDPVDLCDDWQQLAELFHDQTTLNTAIYGLHRRFLAKRKQGSNREILSISLHQAVCRWRLATIGDDKAVWIMNASSALAKYVRSCCSSEAPGRVSFNMAQQFLSPSHHCLDAIQKHVPQEGLRVSGIYADQYFTVCSSIADIFFATGKYRIARDLFSSALSYLREVEAIEVRPNDQFRLTRGLGISCQQTGDLLTAQKELQAALELADALHGHMSDEVIELNPRLKSVHDRISADLDNRKRVLVAVTDGKRQEGKGDTVSSTSFSPCQSRKLSREEWLRVFEDATQENDEAIVTDVLENGANVNKTSDEENSDTPLTVAVELGTEWIVKLLLEQGADVNINWGEDRGKSLSASLKICHFIWEPMTEILDILVKHGADLGDSPRKMRTGLG